MNFRIFNLKLRFVDHPKMVFEKSHFLLFSQKIVIFSKFDAKIDSLSHLRSRNVYFYIHYDLSLKAKAFSIFQNFWVDTMP